MARTPDPLPTPAQREALCELFAQAFIEARSLGYGGRSEQVADLADAFHNLPKEMYGVGLWNVEHARWMLQEYQDKYRAKGRPYNYVAMFNEIFGSQSAER